MNQKPRLLIVEDNPADADLIQEMLPQAGPLNFQVEPVARLSEALARLGRKDVDLVLLDLGLPDSQGLPTFHALRQAAPEIPVIVLTGNDDQELAIAAVRDGAQDYLVKGQFSGGQLIRAIRYALARRQAEEALRQSELKFRTLVEHIPQKVFIKDRESRYLSANENYARDLGIKPEEIAGRMDYDFYPKPLAEKYRADDRRIMRNGEAEEFDEKYLQEGREVWIHTAKTPVRNEAGEVTGILGIFWDISERKRAEIELQRVNRALRLISLCNQEMVRATDEAALLQAVCRIVVEQGGFRMAWVGFAEQDEAKSVRPASHFGVEEGYLDTLNVTWADAQRGRGPTGTAIRTGKPVYARNLSTNPAFGPWRGPAMERGYASSIALPLMDEGRCIGALTLYAGEPDAFDPGEIELLTEMANDLAFGIGALRHRAEGRRAEAAVQASEARFRTLIERSPVAIGISRGGKTIYANQKYLNLFGFQSIDELVRQPIADQWAPEYREMIMERARRRARGEPVPSEYEAIGQRKDGSQFAAHISVSLVELPDGTASMGFLTDITGRKKAEDALRASETLLRESQIVADLGSYVLDIPAGLWRGSDVLDKVFGIDKTYERSVEGWTRLTHPDDRAMMADYLRNEVIGRRQPFDKEYRIIRHNDQAERWVHGMGRLEFDAQGRPVKMLGTIQDITARKRTEATLRESEARNRTLFDKSADGILVADIETKVFKYANPAMCRMLGYTEDELRTKSVLDIHPKDAVQSVVAEFEAQVRGDKVLATDIPCLKKDGSVVHMDINAFQITLDGRRCNAGFFRDITERKQVERDREQAFLRQQGISRLHESLLERRPLRDKLQLVTETIVRLFDADFCRIWLTRPGDLCAQGCMHALTTEGPHVCRRREMCLHLLASAGRYTHLDGAGHRRVPYGAYKIGRIAAQQEAKFLVNDVLQEPLVHDHEWAKKLGLVSFAGYRLQSPGGAPLGVLALFAKRPLTAQEDALLEGLSDAVTSVLLTQLAEDGTRRELAERKRAEEAVRESERRFQTLAISSPVGIFQTDAQGRTIYVNPRWCEIAGLSAADALGDGWLRAVHPDDREKIAQGWRATTHEQGTSKTDYRFVRPDGTIVWVMGQAVPEKDDAGRIVGYVGTIADITERKLAGMVLLNSEVRYRRLFEAAKDGILILDAATGKVMDVNPFLTGLLGFSHQEFLGKTIWELGFFKHIVANQARFEEFQKKEHIRHDDLPLETGDGRRIHVEFVSNVYQVDQHKVIQCNIRDITERKRAEQALRESQAFYHSLVEQLPAGVFRKDRDGRYVFVSSGFCRLKNMKAEDFLGKTPEEVAGEVAKRNPTGWEVKYAAAGRNHHEQIMQTGKPIELVEEYTDADGRKRFVHSMKIPVFDPARQIIGTQGILFDITELKQAEAAVLDSEKRYRQLFELAADAVVLVDSETHRYMDVNQAALRLYGYSREEFLQMTPEEVSAEPEKTREHIGAGDVHVPLRWHRKKNGGRFAVEITASQIVHRGRRTALVTLRDITARQQAAALLEESRKMLRSVLDTIPVRVFWKDAEGRYLGCNQPFARDAGFDRPEELTGKNDHDMGWKEQADLYVADDRRVMASGVPKLQYEEPQTTPAGTRLWLRTSKIPLRDAEDRIIGILGTYEDITEHRKALEQFQRLANEQRTILHTASMGICFIRNRKFEWVNPAFIAMSGYEPPELQGADTALIYARPEDYQTIGREGYAQFAKGAIYRNEMRMRRKDGSLLWCEIAGQAINSQNLDEGSIWSLLDITERKRAEAALRDSEAFLNTVIEKIPHMIFVKDAKELRFVKFNQAGQELLGYSLAELAGKNDYDLFPKKMADYFTEKDRKVLQGRAVVDIPEETIQTRGQGERILHTKKIPVFDNAGQLVFLLGISNDITERKRMEAALIRERDLWRTLLDNSPDKIYFKDTRSRFVKCSRAMAAQFGLKSPDELVGKTDFDLFDESHARPAFEDEQEIIRTGRPMIDREEREESKDGRVTWVTSTKLPWLDDAGKIVGTMGISRDITGRKLVEAELNRERDLWRVLLETSLDNIYFKDIHSRFIKCSKAQARFFGVESPDELVGRTDFDFCAEADARARFEDEQKIIRTGEPIIAKEEREERKAGQVVWMSSTKMPLRDAAGKIIGIMGVSRDITGRKLVEQQVKEALDFNRTIILDAAVGITAFKASGHCILANDTAAKILNGTVPRLLAMDFRKLVSWRASGMLPIAEEVLATKTSRQCDVNFVSSFGKEVWLVSHLSHFVQNGEPHLLHVFSDVTERKKLETQFLRAQRMESIGTLAGGIAHDLNNVLTPLLFSVQILKEKISDDEGQQILDSLEANVKRGASLVKQVLAFGRGVKGDRILLQVRNLAREIEGIVQETFPKSVRFQLDAATGLWTVSCDPTQIHQVLLNLCVNARDAMPGGGKLSLRLNNVTLDAAHAAAHLDARPGPYVVISVEDTGMGISRDNQERIFEPFFTTKELGKGTGLGLSTTLAIVKSHGGFITCNSEPGKGTIFKVYLPASAEAATEAGVPEEQSQLPRGNDELVLVVDDEAPIREMAQHILERYGYRVVLAVNGFDAVQLYTTRQDEIATVLTDMAMPVMDGPATIAALQAVNPKVKIVGFSGLEMKGAEAEAFRLGCGRFVSKPFTAETLLQVLRAILHEPAGERSTDNKPKTKKKRG